MYPDDAQQPEYSVSTSLGYLSISGRRFVPSTEDMIPMQGFASAPSGFRTRSLGSGGRRGGAAFAMVEAPLTTMLIPLFDLGEMT